MSAQSHRLDVLVPEAYDIALLARSTKVSLDEAASLIEQYARTRASEAALQATINAGERIGVAFEEAARAKA